MDEKILSSPVVDSPTHMFWVRQEKTHLGGRAARLLGCVAVPDAGSGKATTVKSVKSPSSPL